jgi:hypothetical protein
MHVDGNDAKDKLWICVVDGFETILELDIKGKASIRTMHLTFLKYIFEKN